MRTRVSDTTDGSGLTQHARTHFKPPPYPTVVSRELNRDEDIAPCVVAASQLRDANATKEPQRDEGRRWFSLTACRRPDASPLLKRNAFSMVSVRPLVCRR